MQNVQANIKKVVDLEKELKYHPCCLNYCWEKEKLFVIFPSGYNYNGYDGIICYESTKHETLKKCIDICEQTWKNSCI